ncbi:R-spondin-2 isoform X1 [Syngnathoides biaculeatus]|uniref:R-spondin-2 isoform X1 n=1 Tax=Syngnathoides biaculeatus TaxID=300417 RepID=UPI002ADD3CEF|nr:R-spondin-2 isoform X1 [Syngnathoides biaculeatus]
MQFRLFSFALILLNCMEYSNCQAPSQRWRRNKRASYGAYPICKGCSVCSRDNGCVNCQPKLFLFLRRERMRQYGECLHECPAGYYGMRSPELNMCSRCRIDNCESCFSKEFCTKCKSGFYLHKGRCFDTCPEGFAPLEDAMECGDGCEVGPWSEWGACTRRNKTCGHKWGLETRTRHIIKKPPKDTIPCPTIAESRRCKMAMRHCRRVIQKLLLLLLLETVITPHIYFLKPVLFVRKIHPQPPHISQCLCLADLTFSRDFPTILN